MIRRMMIYHTGRLTDPIRKIQQARALIDFLARSVPTQDNAYGLLLKSELEIIKKSRDYYLFLDHLEEHWSQALGLEDLFRKIREKRSVHQAESDINTEGSRKLLKKDRLQAYTIGMVELHTYQPAFQRIIPEKPRLSPLAVYQIIRSRPATSQHHESVPVDRLAQRLAPCLDGSRNRSELFGIIRELVEQGRLVVKKDDVPLTIADLTEEILDGMVDRVLHNLSGSALLV